MDTVTYALLKKKIESASSNVKVPSKLSDLSEDANHRTVTDDEKEAWNNKSDFSGSYDDLSNKPTALPSSDVYEWAKSKTKPVYTADEVGADIKGSAAKAEISSQKYTDEKFTELIGTSPENLDTIYELADAILENQSVVDAIEASITNKVDKVEGKGLSSNDLTNELKANYDDAVDHANSTHAPSNAQENIIESISVNGILQTISDKNIDLPLSSPVIKNSASGDMIAVTDSSEMPFAGLRTYGKTTQHTTTGAQLLNPQLYIEPSSQNAAVATVNSDGSITYNKRSEPSEGVTNMVTHWLGEYIDILQDGQTYITDQQIAITDCDGKNTYIKKVTVDKETMTSIRPYVQIKIADFVDGMTVYPMFNIGGTVLPWEPYTGGAPSPNPEHPQEIVSAGNDGSIQTGIYGSNLFDVGKCPDKTERGITGEKTADGGYHIYGTATNYFVVDFINLNLIPGFYFVSDGYGNKKSRLLCNVVRDGRNLYFTNTSFEVKDGETTRGYIQVDPGETVDTVLYPMVNIGRDAMPYEIYRSEQTLSHSTPNGFHGIPVTSGGNYTDEAGQQWIADYRDWDRGVDVQMVGKFIVDENTNIVSVNKYSTGGLDEIQPFRVTEYANMIKKSSPMLCDKLVNALLWSRPIEGCYATEATIDFNIQHERIGTTAETTPDEAVQKLKEWLVDNPLTFLCILAEPIETPIPSDEIVAYRALRTNHPNTTIYNNAKTWMELEYVADPQNYIEQNYVSKDTYVDLENRVAALETKITS